jgi:hypothetical protein
MKALAILPGSLVGLHANSCDFAILRLGGRQFVRPIMQQLLCHVIMAWRVMGISR